MAVSYTHLDVYKRQTYYLRSRPATRIAKTTVAEPMPGAEPDSAATACSLENPAVCEACQ